MLLACPGGAVRAPTLSDRFSPSRDRSSLVPVLACLLSAGSHGASSRDRQSIVSVTADVSPIGGGTWRLLVLPGRFAGTFINTDPPHVMSPTLGSGLCYTGGLMSANQSFARRHNDSAMVYFVSNKAGDIWKVLQYGNIFCPGMKDDDIVRGLLICLNDG